MSDCIYSNGNFLEAHGIVLRAELKVIKKNQGGMMQPLYEAFSNSWEALIEKYGSAELNRGIIKINVYFKSKLLPENEVGCDFDKLVIVDNGTGITVDGFKRITHLRDNSKNTANRGTGRVQYIHCFENTKIITVYKENSTYKERTFFLSKKDDFLSRNAILWFSEPYSTEKNDTGCIVEFSRPWENQDGELFSQKSTKDIKNELLIHYLSRFAHHRENMPQIIIERYLDDKIASREAISKKDILIPDKEEEIQISYSIVNNEGKIVKDKEHEKFILTSFVDEVSLIKENAIYLLGKEELANKIPFHDLKASDSIDNKRYLFFLSGNYLDERDDDARGNITLVRKKLFRERAQELPLNDAESKQILWEDIEDAVNAKIINMYSCITDKNVEQLEVIEDLKNMFLLDDGDVNYIAKKVKKSDSPSLILEKVYDLEAKRNAKADAQIHSKIIQLNKLNPKDKGYKIQLEEGAKELANLLPARNKHLLARYVCRRKIVLNLLNELLEKSKDDNSSVDEAMLHNLFIKRNSTDVANSDLWLMNEEYLYFRGISDQPLDKASLDGHKIIKETLSEEEEEYKCRAFNDINEDQGLRRPDILLFPEENKCIIIEFKAPKVDVSKHLDQISRYATLIRNLAKEEYLCDKFYGYLIGENINYDSVTDAQADFEEAPTKDCLYRQNVTIKGKFGRAKGYLYTEIIKYSDLLKRAGRRNQVFTDFLFNSPYSDNNVLH